MSTRSAAAPAMICQLPSVRGLSMRSKTRHSFLDDEDHIRSCECDCQDAKFGSEKSVCVSRSSHYWDERTCQCRSKTVSPRETDARLANCLDDFSGLHHSR